MNNCDQKLPQFRNPPVIETVLGVYFRELEKFNSAEQGIFWDRYFRTKFPNLEERPPTEELRERFGEDRLVPGADIRWRVSQRPDTPRLWAASQDGQHVIQIQRNGFLTNWLKSNDGVTYKSFGEKRLELANKLGQLNEFLQDRTIGQIKPTSWVVTYINHIDYEGLDNVGPSVADIITTWTNTYSDDWLVSPDNLVLDIAFPMPSNAGRLNVKLTPVFENKSKQHKLRLELTARGQQEFKDLESLLLSIDLGHEWVVRGFTSLTRPEMHKLWERV
ncbi:MAG: TIGR04255 family protein [Pirellulales bacterium]|nr:TIGR04255 family protein [Pirellulales bacterium]